jgi:hypothetical protein
MGMLRVCSADGCETKTLGAYCIEHEDPSEGDDLNHALQIVVREVTQAVEPPPLEPNV